MADQERDLSKVLSNVERDMALNPAPAPTPRTSQNVEAFVPSKHRMGAANDSMEQIQRDLAKAILDTEQRTKALIEELKRITS